MLAQYLRKVNTAQTLWSDVMPGIQACCFVLGQPTDVFPLSLPPEADPMHFEVLFCRKGCLILEQAQNRCITAGEQEIILLSGRSSLRSAQVDISLEGVLITIDVREHFCALRDLRGDLQTVMHCVDNYGGCACLKNTAWTQGMFAVLEGLTGTEQGEYCMYKTVEIIHLLCKQDQMLTLVPYSASINDPMTQRVRDMHAYMEQHLQEKLTISVLCDRFYISPTLFKEHFRCIYGQPVHRWLQQRRMERAAQQLLRSDATVLRIAQAVGYNGLGQFSAAFKRFYGCTPKQYRTASKSVDLQPIPQNGDV